MRRISPGYNIQAWGVADLMHVCIVFKTCQGDLIVFMHGGSQNYKTFKYKYFVTSLYKQSIFKFKSINFSIQKLGNVVILH